MIKPLDSTSGRLEFRCDACGTMFHHAIRIFNDLPADGEEQEYDVRNWTAAAIDLQCPKCFAERTYQLELRPEKRRGVM